ncbi:MAG: hypothetical protein QOE24_1567, partial [Frankiales bacterium]|nr:hypothetical protein [Frankiales bacterium]
SNVTMTNNTVIGAWGGKGIGIYGGGGHVVNNNYISDTARYIGLGVGKFGVNGSDLTSATVSGNMIVRSGGNGYNQGQPALHIGNGGDGQSSGTVSNATVTGNTIVDAMYDGIGFSTTYNANVANNTITSPWRNGIVIQPPFYPAPSGSATISGNQVTGLRSGMSPYTNNSSGFTATVSGNSWQGATAVVGASPSSLSFTSNAVGTSSAAQPVTVSNTGSAAATISSVSTTAGFGQTNNCGTSVAAGASCTVNVTYTPTASGTTTGTLNVNGSNPVSVSLSGTVSTSGGGSTNLSTGATMTANSTQQTYVASNANDSNANTYWEGAGAYPQWLRVDFGSVKSVSSVTVTVPPASTWAARTQTFSVEGSADGTTWTTLSASAGRVFNPSTGNTVTIALPASSTARYVRLSFTGNTGATGGQVSEFQVFGGTTGGGGSASVSASPTSLSFAATNVGSASSAQNVTISNSGTAAASVSGVSTSGDFSQTNTCGTSIAAGASCTASVTFRPTANGSRTGTLAVAGSNPVSVSLSGTGNTVTNTGNLATGKSMSSSGYTQTYAPANANDGNQATYWEGTANAYPNWLQVDLGSSQTVGRVVLKLPTTWGARTQTLSVLGSTDGGTWTTLKASAAYAFNPSANTVTITFTGMGERYVRINFTANSGASGGQVSELEVYSS